jgi:4-amino-4-deoxy-L-arabinose transferase-like glycosyltransferase
MVIDYLVLSDADTTGRRRLGWAPLVCGLATSAVLICSARGYGYFRDEFYYIAAGRHPAFGYVDQPPLTPLLARIGWELFGGDLVGLRLLPALAAGATVVLTGVLAGELGGNHRARALAAASMAVATYPLGVGHIVSTSTFDLLFWTACTWMLVCALRDGGPAWLAAGAVAGLGLENKTLLIALPAALGAAVLMVGPRDSLRGRWPWLATLVALTLWAPNLAWQAGHGWPQLHMAEAISEVGNGGSAPRWVLLPMQLVLFGLLLVPIWVAGLRTLARSPRWRAFALAYALLAVLIVAVDGKPYYLGGMYPMLLAAGAQPVQRWAHSVARRWLVGTALVLTAVTSAVLMLPVLPARELPGTPIVALQPISADSVGWPQLAAAISRAYRSLPAEEQARTIMLGRNYGEAGAVELFRDRSRAAMPLPPAYSGHNSYYDWGPPPETASTVIAIGFDQARLLHWFASVQQVGRVDNGVAIANAEQHQPVWLCRHRRTTWSLIWPHLHLLG